MVMSTPRPSPPLRDEVMSARAADAATLLFSRRHRVLTLHVFQSGFILRRQRRQHFQSAVRVRVSRVVFEGTMRRQCTGRGQKTG